MEWPWLYPVLVAILKPPKIASEVTYNLKDEATSRFSCYHNYMNALSRRRQAIKLFLGSDALKIICHLYNIGQDDTKQNRRKNLLLYTAKGLAPSIQIFNSTYSEVFYFKMKLGDDVDSWWIEIPRDNITFNTDLAPLEQWFVKFKMHHGLNMFNTEGTLLDVVREPILHWDIGEKEGILPVAPYVKDLIITKSPCAADVAFIGLFTESGPSGIRLGLTRDGFLYPTVQWFNLSSSICSILNYDCSELRLVNVILTNTHLVILSTLGLFISEDLRFWTGRRLSFYKPNFCGFEVDDYIGAKIWYNMQCLANLEDHEEDYLSLTFNKDKTLSQESTCFYSNAPFREWYSCLSHRTESERKISRRVFSFLIDTQQNTGIALISQQTDILVWVHKLTDQKLHRQRKFPAFRFPDQNFLPLGMFFHPNSHFLYVYGNQVWMSEDGGNNFNILIKLENETVVERDSCVYTQAIVFVTDIGNIFYTKAGLKRFARLTAVAHQNFTIYFDHLGDLNTIGLNTTSPDMLSVTLLNVEALLQDDDFGFDGPLSPQFITEEQMLFFSHEPVAAPAAKPPRFHNLHIDKALLYLSGGRGLISKVYMRANSPQFLSAALVDVLDRYPIEDASDSPCLNNDLTISDPAVGTTEYILDLSHVGANEFLPTDIEKTVVIPGYSSILIVNVVSSVRALGDATMPNRVPVGILFATQQWFMYDFGTTNSRKWSITVDICRYTIQQAEDLPINSIIYLDLGETQNFTFKVTPINIAFPVFHMPLMKIVVGRPSLVELEPEHYWDIADSYIMQLSIHSQFFEQGKTSIAVIAEKASLLCDVTTMILTVKNSCSYLKTMHYVLPTAILASDWLSTSETKRHKMAASSKVLKNLPVNYRPPSTLGIAVPLTENFYHADPSKPRMRNHFVASKTSGKYKQCAGKKDRNECGCTNNMKLSFSVVFSDCKEKALRMKFPVSKLPLNFTVKDAGGFKVLLAPYFITIIEVNNRTNWEISGSKETSSVLKIRKYLANKLNTSLYNPDGLSLSIYGSELFHFRVSTIPGVSFCNLFDEFQIYIDDVPLAFPGGNLINSVTAVLIGSFVFLAFLIQVNEVQVGNILRTFRRNKVASKTSFSTISTASTDTSKK